MNRLFNTNYNHRGLDIALLVLRVSIALLMLYHGIPKMHTLFSGEAIRFPDPVGVGATASLSLVVFAEVLCSALILIGLGTRLAVIPLIINMLVAVLVIHGQDGLEKMEAGLHYLLVYIVLLFTGSGRISFDSLISRKAARPRRGY